MKKRLLMTMATVFVGLTLATVSPAQTPAKDQSPAQGQGRQQGMGRRGGMPEQFRYTFQLTRATRNITELEKNKETALTPAQAKQVLAILKPLRSKPKLTSDQAKAASIKLEKVFTLAQQDAIAKMRPQFGRDRGTRQGDGQRPGLNRDNAQRDGQKRQGVGQRGQNARGQAGNQQRRWDQNTMKDFNPFYVKPAKGDKMAAAQAKRWNEFFASLEVKAKSK